MDKSNYRYKFKGLIMSISIFFLLNAYLVYILSTYIVDKHIMSLFILISNEMFLFIGVAFYLIFKLKVEFNDKIKVLEYLIKRNKK